MLMTAWFIMGGPHVELDVLWRLVVVQVVLKHNLVDEARVAVQLSSSSGSLSARCHSKLSFSFAMVSK